MITSQHSRSAILGLCSSEKWTSARSRPGTEVAEPADLLLGQCPHFVGHDPPAVRDDNVHCARLLVVRLLCSGAVPLRVGRSS